MYTFQQTDYIHTLKQNTNSHCGQQCPQPLQSCNAIPTHQQSTLAKHTFITTRRKSPHARRRIQRPGGGHKLSRSCEGCGL